METLGIGCKIGKQYCGIFVYCDDIFLLSCSKAGLQAMVNICESWAKTHNMQFSTNQDVEKSKTKCIIFSKKKVDTKNISKIMLNGTPLPYVDSCKHLGMNLFCDNTFDKDCDIKRSKFIGKVHSINQELYFASSDVLLKLLNVYCTSFFGSNCWNLFSKNCNRFYQSSPPWSER